MYLILYKYLLHTILTVFTYRDFPLLNNQQIGVEIFLSRNVEI